MSLDAAVADAYGWPAQSFSEEEILEKLVALNKERAAEEARGLVRWLRPDYQNRGGVQQAGMDVQATEVDATTIRKEATEWPKSLAEQAQTVQRILGGYQHPVSADMLNKQFKKTAKASNLSRQVQIENLLETFSILGLLRKTDDGLFVK